MSTGGLRAGGAVALALTVVLTGCGGDGGQDDGPGEGAGSSSARTPTGAGGAGTPSENSASEKPSSQPPSPSSPAPTSGPATSAGAATGTDVDACFDGRCAITVAKPMAIEVDSRFGIDSVRITRITADAVQLQSSGSGIFLSASVGEGGTGGLNALGFRVKSLEGGRAVLEFFPKD